MIAFVFECNAFYCSQFVFLPIFGFYLGFCWLIISFVKDITNDLDQFTLNECQNHDQITGTFCEIVELYLELKQLSPSFQHSLSIAQIIFHFSMVVEFNEIYEFVPTCFILWCLLELCVEVLLLQIFLVECEWWFISILVSYLMRIFNAFAGEQWEFHSCVQCIDVSFCSTWKYFYFIGIRSDGEQSIWSIWWEIFPMWLVPIPNQNTTNVRDIYDIHSRFGDDSGLWKFMFHARHFWKGEFSINQ